MPPRNTNATRAAADVRAAPTDPEREEDLEEGDDEREGAADRQPDSPADPHEALFAAAKKKFGLPDGASPLDLLKHIVGSPTARPAGPPRAACSLVLDVDGKRVVLNEGDRIPEGVDLGALERRHPHAVTRG